jgi:ubiquinol-cytochrome c reductase iron-sulfur subunit
MSNKKKKSSVDQSRRTWVTVACVTGGAGVAATMVPFVSSFAPSEKAKIAGAPVEVDISSLSPGQMMTVEWRGKPVWIIYRTQDQLDALPTLTSKLADPNSKRPGITPSYAENVERSIRPEIFVCVGICTHLGCAPSQRFEAGPQPSLPNDWEGGFLCPCHGSLFDMAGRVYKGMPAPDNLEVPPYMYLSENKILIGEHTENA